MLSKFIRNVLVSSSNRQLTISVEGNIASGKTCFLNYFKNHPIIETVPEPVHEWRNFHEFNLLDMMYEDPSRWSLTFQTYVQLTMVKNHCFKQLKQIKMMERSILSAKYCFVDNLYQSGKMPKVDYLILTDWFNFLQQNLPLKIDLIIYLQTKPETCFQRLRERCRAEELKVNLDYLKELHEIHEKWLVHKTVGSSNIPVFCINADKDLSSLDKEYNNLCTDEKRFLAMAKL